MANSAAGPQLVTTLTPLRISFAGGGTDLMDYYAQDYGAVLSTTINKYVYVTAKRHGVAFKEAYRLNYAESEIVDSLDRIKNTIIRECLRLVPVEPPLYISTVADLPASSGMGSSSSFAVGLLTAFHTMRQEYFCRAQLMEEAAHVEINMLKNPIGKQDQAAAVFGGFNYIRFLPNESISLEPINLSNANLEKLFQHLQLYWTGITRNSADVLTEQKQSIEEKRTYLDQMRDQAKTMRDMLRNQNLDMDAFGRIMDDGWALKRQLASKISNDQLDIWYELAKTNGAIGGKICGAGGGGFLMLVVPPENQTRVKEALSDMEEVPIYFDAKGSRILSMHAE